MLTDCGQPRRRAANRLVPSTRAQTNPSAVGIRWLGLRSAAIQSDDEAGNRASTRGRSSVISRRFRRVARSTRRPATRRPGADRRTTATLSARPRMTSPPSANRSTSSTTATSASAERSRITSTDRERREAGSIECSTRARQPPGSANVTIAACPRRWAMSRGRSEPGRASRTRPAAFRRRPRMRPAFPGTQPFRGRAPPRSRRSGRRLLDPRPRPGSRRARCGSPSARSRGERQGKSSDASRRCAPSRLDGGTGLPSPDRGSGGSPGNAPGPPTS